MRPVYLDNNATTRVDPAVVDAMLPYFTEQFGNPSSSHAFGARVGDAVKEARAKLATLIGAARDHEIVFTSGGTESNNAAILSAVAANPARRGVITSTVEHPAVLAPCDQLARRWGITVHRIPVDSQGRLDLDRYMAALSPDIAVVSIMWANNETGVLFPVEELARRAKRVGALFHTDAVQAVGKIPIDVKTTDIDMLSLSAHKLHAPKGIGALYLRKGVRFEPMLTGGHQERGRRAGTENAPGIIALGKAAELAASRSPDEHGRVRALRDRLESGVLRRIDNCFVVGDRERRLPNTSAIALEHIESDGILLMLGRAGIAASSGSACASGSLEPSHVPRAMKVPETAARGTIRFSLSRDNCDADVDRVLEVLPGIVEKLRGPAPFWSKEGATRALAPSHA